MDTDELPHQNHYENDIFVDMELLEANGGKLLINLTGRLPVQSRDGMHSIFLIYDYDRNVITVEPIKMEMRPNAYEHTETCMTT